MAASTLINYIPGSYLNISSPGALGKFLTAELQKISTTTTLANTQIAAMQAAWTPFTPVLTPTSGAFTTLTSLSAYMQDGKTVHCRIDVTITSIGTAVGPITMSLPVLPVTGPSQAALGRESANTGKSIACRIKPGTLTTSGLVNYDGTDTAIAALSRYEFNFTYECA